MAWRNLWRNKKRTFIALSSVFFAAFLCMVFGSFMEGATDYMIDTTIERQIGHFQVMNPEYKDDKIVDNFLIISQKQLNSWESNPKISRLNPRIETFAMAWNGNKTRPIGLIGVDPRRENLFSKLEKRIRLGHYLSQKDNGIIIGKHFSQSMNLNIGDTLTLIGQGYHGATASGLFPIRAIMNSYDAQTDASIAYTSISTARDFIDLPDGASYISVLLKDEKNINEVINELRQDNKGNNYRFEPWEELIKNTMAGIASDKKTFALFFYILYIVVGFGLFGTVVMMTNEREKEFSVMSSLGMKKKSLIIGLFFELLIINIIGLILSIIIATPIITYFHSNPVHLTGQMARAMDEYGIEPIFPFALEIKLFFNQIIAITLMSIFTIIYPIGKLSRLSIIDTLRK
ncbi:MAG: transporter substrate-binding protein [Bacteroidetes bacterium]|nr:transporter substrate-binding protein [Bacteroidota bacterium]